jgi:uridine phosphorylase
VISTGIGTDNVDIVMNEIDALFNVDFETRQPRQDIKQLTFLRLGTSGGLQREIPLDSVVVAPYALGLDAMARLGISHTDELSQHWFDALEAYLDSLNISLQPAYMSLPDTGYVSRFRDFAEPWITVTCAGFYGLQGRSIRLQSQTVPLLQAMREFDAAGLRIGNLEMETAGIYLLAKLMGHKAAAVNAVIANRYLGTFSADPKGAVDRMIQQTLLALTSE